MLDDLKKISQMDGQDALGFAAKQAEQLRYDFRIKPVDLGGREINNIVWAGMGGSALPAVITANWPDYRLPFEIVRQYHIPKYVGANTLFIASSYSGNTEETLSALAEAEAAGALIVVIAGGGRLAEIAETKGYQMAKLPFSPQPRFATLYFIGALVALLQGTGLLAVDVDRSDVSAVADFLDAELKNWGLEIPTSKNRAKQIALELAGKSPVVYAGPLLYPAANKWKICFNENAKNVAWSGQYPEFNHNEFLGWTSHPVDKPYAVVEIRSNLEDPQIRKRFTISEKLLSGQRPAPIVVEPAGDNLAQQLLAGVVLGDFVSFYLAFLNGLDPSPVELIEKLKKELQ